MEALRTKGVAHKGILTVQVPKEFEDKELEVIILTNSEIEKNDEERDHEGKVKRLLSIVGAAKYPDFAITKYDVYDQ